ncbi:arginine--tRNA ligase [bacterium]|nr:arginine--tRNA ligase [bacterium]
MAMTVLDRINEFLFEIVDGRCKGAGVDAPARESYGLSLPRQPEHGDLATNVALMLSKPMRRNPMQIAEEIAHDVVEHVLVASAEVAKPGFINLRLSDAAYNELLNQVRTDAENYGDKNVGGGERILIEFVSANPTGPMHIGHLRHAVLGEAISRILRSGGYDVTKEYYINDGGNQIATLAATFDVRLREALGEEAELGENMYPGEYLLEFAHDLIEEKGAEGVWEMEPADRADYAKNRCLDMIKNHLAILEVFFDEYVSEKALYEAGKVAEALETLKEQGETYEEDGALWLRTEHHGDDKDRVLVKSDETLTYLVPDLAYHHEKFKRSFDHYINVFGSDHVGYGPRLKAGIQCLGHDPEKLEIILLRLVFLVRAGERLDMGKRSGNVINAIDLVNDVGADVARYFLLERSAGSEINFDLDLAKEHSDRNPVFKVQYAHARICTLLGKAAEAGFAPAEADENLSACLDSDYERAILLHLLQFPEVVGRSARDREPHHIPAYLLEMAEKWNRYWSAARQDDRFRIIVAEEPERTRARLALAEAVRQVLRNGLMLLAISAPDRMERDEEEST